MNKSSYHSMWWILAVCMIVAVSLGLLLLHHSQESSPSEVSSVPKEQIPVVQLQGQLQAQANRDGNQAKSEEGGTKSHEVISNGESESAAGSDQTDVAKENTSDPEFEAIVDQATNEIAEGYKLLVEDEDKLEITKTAFFEAFNNEKINSVKVHGLIREADEEGKAWIRAELVKRYDSDPSPRIRQACLLSVAAFPEATREMLSKALSDSDRSVRTTAATIASRTYFTENELGVLFQAVREYDAEPGYPRYVARLSIMAIGLIGGEKASTFLKEVWHDEKLSSHTRVETLFALGCISEAGNFEILESVLKGEDESIRGNAAFGLSNMALLNAPQIDILGRGEVTKSPQVLNKATDLLRRRINDDNRSVRMAVVDCLGSVGNTEDIDILTPLLDDTYSKVTKFSENGKIKEIVVYPIREKTKKAIGKINARLASHE